MQLIKRPVLNVAQPSTVLVRVPPPPSRKQTARAFEAGDGRVIDLQASVEFKDRENQRAAMNSHAVPTVRVRQILKHVTALDVRGNYGAEWLKVDVCRHGDGRYQRHFGLAMAMAMASSLFRLPISEPYLFLGDVDLLGQVTEASTKVIDALNVAIQNFVVETPLTVLSGPNGAVWLRTSTEVNVVPVRSLKEAAGITWPNERLDAF